MSQLLRRIALGAVLSLASTHAFAIHAAPNVASAVSGKLDAALDSIRADNIRSDIQFIASDELGGRDTPSTGQRIAARFLRARLMRLGVKPGAGDDYLYKYKLYAPKLDVANTSAKAVKDGETVALSFGTDYGFHTSGITTLSTEGNLAWCGNIEAEELTNLQLAGKWAMCVDNRDSTKDRSAAAKKAGAVGVILLPGDRTTPERMATRIQESARSAKSPQAQFRETPVEEVAVYPYVQMTQSAADRLFTLAGPAFAGGSKPAPGTDMGVVFSDVRQRVGRDGSVEVENVCGFWPGNDPKLSKEVILISAHYDHVGTNAEGVVFNGADDNGSGTTGLLQIAEALTVHGPMRRSVMLIWVSGEEKGLWGSKAWCMSPSLPDGHRAVCNLNIDMIGRNAPDKLLITPTKGRKADYNGLTRLAEANAPLEGFPELGSADAYWFRSDQVNFAEYLKVPVAFLFSDVHDDYHKPGDDPEKIDCDKIRRVARLVVRMLDGLQGDVLDL